MKTTHPFLITMSLLLFIIMSSCKKDPVIASPAAIQPGVVQFDINDGVTLKQAYTAIRNATGGKDYELYNFYYTKTIQEDSMTYYWTLFKAQSYIFCFDVFRKPGENFTRFRDVDFKNLNDATYQQWDSLVKNRSLIEMPNDGGGYSLRKGLLHVTNGEESIWIKILKQLPEIQHADFVYISNFPE